MQDVVEKLNRIKKRIDKAKKEMAMLEGKKEQLLARLKSEFRVDSIEQAKKKLETLKDKKDRIETEIEEKMSKLEEYFSD